MLIFVCYPKVLESSPSKNNFSTVYGEMPQGPSLSQPSRLKCKSVHVFMQDLGTGLSCHMVDPPVSKFYLTPGVLGFPFNSAD